MASLGYPKHPKWHYDLSKSLQGVEAPKPSVQVNDDLGTSFINPSFAFRHEDGKAGQTCQAQLSIVSNAVLGSAPIVLESISIEFEGSIKPVLLFHEPGSNGGEAKRGSVSLNVVSLAEAKSGTEQESEDAASSSYLRGTSNLTLGAGLTTVFEMKIPLREPGEASASSLKFTVNNDAFILTYSTSIQKAGTGHVWYTEASRRRMARTHPQSIRVLPRPPKMEIKEVNLLDQYYTNEVIELPFDIVNEEDADATAKLDVTVLGEEPPDFRLRLADGDEKSSEADDEESSLQGAALGAIKSSGSSRVTMIISAVDQTTAYTLTLRVSYSLVTDPETTIIQSAAYQINVASPFEANYELLPRLHPDPWPSLFDHEGIKNPSADGPGPSHGLAQAWCLVTRYASFASEDLNVMDLDVEIQPAHGIQCQTSKRKALPPAGLRVSPKTIEETQFDVAVKRASLDDRNPTGLDVSFIIKWTRLGQAAEPGSETSTGTGTGTGTDVNRTVLAVPRLPIFGTEPRVLASVSYSDPSHSSGGPGGDGSRWGRRGGQIVFLDITIENGSNHFLTFGLNMDPSDEYAFSGSKQTTLSLLPISRRAVTYRLLPLVEGGTWIRPSLTVRDKYFQKVLKIIPTEGMKVDKEGVLIWIPLVDDDGE